MDAPYDLLTRLTALSPHGLGGVNALVRATCAASTGLTPLAAEGEAADDPAVRDFAEQFATDVASVTTPQREAFLASSGKDAFAITVLTFVADYVPRVQAGLHVLGLPPIPDAEGWDHDTDPIDLVLNQFAPTVGAMRALDPVTTEVVRLRGAVQHDCRLCRSLREETALDAGGTESMYDDIERYETSTLLDDGHKAALRYVDALIWTPARIDAGLAAGLRSHFTEPEAFELTLDVMRNAANKIAVSLGADAPRVTEGTERYLLGMDGQPVYG